MLAKVITLRNERGGQVSAKDLVDYLVRESEELAQNQFIEGGTFNLDNLSLSSAEDRLLAIQLMDHTAEAGRQKTRFTGNPYYHFALSWREAEHPTKAQCEQAAQHTLKALGLEKSQAVWFVHRDTQHHHHLHVVANRVDPDRLVLSGPPRYDFFVLDKACREIELMQGWQHDNGPYAVIDGLVVKLSKKDRAELGLLATDKPEHAPSPKDRMHALHTGVPAFAEWLRDSVAPELKQLISLPNADWQAMHTALAKRGVEIKASGGGLVFVTRVDGRENSTKASGIDYRFSAGRLQKILGEFQLPTALTAPDPDKTYDRHIANVRSGIVAGEHPGKTGNTAERAKQREQRQQAREELAARFAVEKKSNTSNGKAIRTHLSQQHQQAKSELLKTIKAGKPERIAELTAEHGSRRLALGLYAAEKISAIQTLQDQQKTERASLSKILRMEWPAWLEQKAQRGDEAAKSALRGIRYREQKKLTRQRPGFEGEELDALKPYDPTNEKPSGSITGDVVPSFRLVNANVQIDYQKQRITYLDEQGQIRLTDSGQRVDVHQKTPDTLEQGLLLAAQKFGGEIYITGDAEFREQAAQQAARMGISVADEDLCEVIQQERMLMQQEQEKQPRSRG